MSASAMRLCLQPIGMPVAEDDERRAKLEQAMTERLEETGFEIVSSEEVNVVIERVDEQWGKIFDPITGRRIPDQWERFKQELARALAEELGCERRLVVSVAMLRAPFADGRATWDGARISVTSGPRIVRNILIGVHESGWLSALSLWVQILELNGDPLFFRSAGIEPLVDFSMSNGQDRLPEDLWLRNEDRIADAIRSALGPDNSKIRSPNSIVVR